MTTNGGEKMGNEQTQLQTAVKAEVARPKSKTNEFRDVLEKMKPQIALALPRHVTPDRMLRIVLTTVQRTPKLLECTRESLLACIVQCAQLGLEPDGLLGHAYLIPFWNSRANDKRGAFECQLIVGYKGLLKLARQSAEISSISARVVHAKDTFSFRYGLREKLVHIPSDEADPGKLVYAYAIFRLKDGGFHFDVMTAREIDRIRDNSQGYKRDPSRSPWTEHYEEMAKKTVLRRASKMSPASIEDKTARAIALDEQAEAGLPQEIGDGISVPAVDDSEPPPQEGQQATEAQAPEPAKEFVVSTLAQRKQLAKGIKEARISEADVCGWSSKHTFEELSFDECAAALERLNAMIADEAGAAIK